MKISIITVSYNAVKTIEKTILSVIEQDFNDFEYIIIDGGSTDGTVDVIRKYEKYLSYYVSEPDNGMYDALVKGFRKATGEIIAYINADDMYQPHAFQTINSIFEKYKDIKWLTGINTVYNASGQIVDVNIPGPYSRRLIQKGFYDGKYLPFIQQESTFWRKELLSYIDIELLSRLKLAGDYYLWKCFSQYANIYVVSCVLAGFRKQAGQLSENIDSYRQEIEGLCGGKINIFVIEALLFKIIGKLPKRFNKYLLQYDFEKESW